MLSQRKDVRENGDHHSAFSKSKGDNPTSKYLFNVGDLVHIKLEGDKHNTWNFYLVVDVGEDKK